MSSIPEARKYLADVQLMLGWFTKEIEHHLKTLDLIKANVSRAVALMTREPPIRKAKTKSRLTLEKAKAIKAYARANPKASFREIGTHFDVNDGRVSEVLTGKRFSRA